jgi:hypothetical protein
LLFTAGKQARRLMPLPEQSGLLQNFVAPLPVVTTERRINTGF